MKKIRDKVQKGKKNALKDDLVKNTPKKSKSNKNNKWKS